jgi:ATP-dependent Clp protease protease subunit
MTNDEWSHTLEERLFAQRVVILRGPLNDAAATQLAAQLMTLDAEGETAVSLRIDSAEGSLAVALTLMDVIELMGVAVRALCLGQVGGPAIGVLSVCRHRAAMPSTRFYLREPATQMEARATDVALWAQVRAEERNRFCSRVGSAIGKSVDAVSDDLASGIFLGAGEALAYGLIDEVCRPEKAVHRSSGPPLDFRPFR